MFLGALSYHGVAEHQYMRLDDFDGWHSDPGINTCGQFRELLTGCVHSFPVALDFVLYIVPADAVFNNIEFVALSKMDTPDRDSGRHGMSFQGQAH
jgi:hypothetical protein